ncbi:hypothetical protein CRG98_009337 [Punica granatum]|uniref:Tf2-1-like SH3-like domain-containing protein n=1 Tax=Punica granatum TaxID=22663 RepID=A0A2I0KPJ9_PUNGR|nr:hypothetical protein CRG98_009337 [Punica granatum]
MRKERFPNQRKSKLSPRGIRQFQGIAKINDNAYRIDFPGLNSRTNPFEEQGNDEDRGHDNEADAHELGSRIREEGANAQDLGGLHEFGDVFPEELPKGLPPIWGIKHQIDFVPGAAIPNRSAYRSNPEEAKALQRQVDELLAKGHES